MVSEFNVWTLLLCENSTNLQESDCLINFINLGFSCLCCIMVVVIVNLTWFRITSDGPLNRSALRLFNNLCYLN